MAHRPKTFLMAPWLYPGHTVPFIAIAEELSRKGHLAWVYAEPQAQQTVERVGATFVKQPSAGMRRDVESATSSKQLALRLGQHALKTAPHLLKTVEKLKPDVIVTDELNIAAGLVAQASSCAWASMPLTPPMLVPTPSAAQAQISTARIRALLGLPKTSLTSLEQGISPMLRLLPWTPRFHPKAAVKTPAQRHVGPLLLRGQAQNKSRNVKRVAQPLILASLSTLPLETFREAQQEYLNALVEATNAIGIRTMISGPASAFRTLKVAPAKHLEFYEFIPHEKWIDRASIMIHQGGAGSLNLCLQHRVPMLIVPLLTDQRLSAALCERNGFGFSLTDEQRTPTLVCDRIHRLLNERDLFRNAMKPWASEIHRFNGPVLAAKALLTLAERR